VSIGEALTAARTKAGMTVEQVSDITRVRQTLVRQIEADDFSNCGGDFYARGHIRSIANAVGADPVPLLAEYDEQRAPTLAPRATQVFEPDAVRAERRGPNWTAAMVVALAVVCIWGLVQVFTPPEHPRKARPQAGAAAQPTATQAPSTEPTANPTATQAPGDGAVAAVPRDGVTVRLIGVDQGSWLSVTGTNNKRLYEGILRNGRVRDFADKRVVRLIVGDADGIRLIVNGKDLGMPGKDGAVVRLRFGPGDPQAAG
jgi:cytoskeleton protein RodZ